MEHNQNLTMSDIRYWYELEEMLELLHLVIDFNRNVGI